MGVQSVVVGEPVVAYTALDVVLVEVVELLFLACEVKVAALALVSHAVVDVLPERLARAKVTVAHVAPRHGHRAQRRREDKGRRREQKDPGFDSAARSLPCSSSRTILACLVLSQQLIAPVDAASLDVLDERTHTTPAMCSQVFNSLVLPLRITGVQCNPGPDHHLRTMLAAVAAHFDLLSGTAAARIRLARRTVQYHAAHAAAPFPSPV